MELRRLIAFAAGMALIGGVGLASSSAVASAESIPGDFGSCAGQGTASLYADASHTVPTTIAPGFAGSEQVGSYHFSGPGVCTVAGDPTDTGTTGLTTITSDGNYQGALDGVLTPCGSGQATGVATIVVSGEAYTLDYTITFINGQGPLIGTALVDSDGDIRTSRIEGWVSIQPIPDTGCTLAPAVGFTIEYAIAGLGAA